MTGELRDAARAEHAVNSGAGPVRITRDAQPKAPAAAAQLKDDVARLTAELHELAIQRQYDIDTLTRVISERDDARGQLRVAEGDQDAAQQRVATLEARLTAAHHDRDAAKATVRRQAAEILTAVDEIAKAERAWHAALTARNSLARELEQVKAHVARQNDRITTLDAERDDAIQSRDFAQQRASYLNAFYAAREAALADDIAKAREQVRKTQAEKGSRGFRRSKARERRAAALATVTALERVARRQP